MSAYIEHMGASGEETHAFGSLSSDHPKHASYLIVRSCVLLHSGDDRAADRSLGSVRDHMRQYAEVSSRNVFDVNASYGAHVFHLAQMLIDRDAKETSEEFRTAAHTQAIEELRRIRLTMVSDPSRRGELKGRRTEQLLVALATRDVAEDLVTQALFHHDMSRDPDRNYDFLTVCAEDGEPNQLQLKDGCLDFCQDRQGVSRGVSARRHYVPRIALIAGECDVHHGDPATMTAWVIGEANQGVAPEVTETLDARSAELLEILIAPESWRMGTAQPNPARA